MRMQCVTKGTSNRVLFYDEAEDLRILVCGDDFCAMVDQGSLNDLDDVFRRRYEQKVTGRSNFIDDESDSQRRGVL